MQRKLPTARVQVEALEDRDLPSTGYNIATSVVPPPGWLVYQQLTEPDGTTLIVGTALDAAKNPSYANAFDVAVARYNPDGSLDTTFGNGGTVLTAVDGWADAGYDVAVQPDGKIVVVGATDSSGDWPGSGGYSNEPSAFVLVRYNADGSLDTTFGTGGEVITSFPFDTGGGAGQAMAVALQPDGAIVVAGTSTANGPHDYLGMNEFTVARYTPDGELDTTFGSGGVVQVSFGGIDVAQTVTVQADGTILATGISVQESLDPALSPWPDYSTPSIETVSLLLNADGSVVTVSYGPVTPSHPDVLQPGDGGGTLILRPTPIAFSLTGAGSPSSPATTPSPPAHATAAASVTATPANTATPSTVSVSQPAIAFVQQSPVTTVGGPQTPVNPATPVTIVTPTGGPAVPTGNASNAAPIGTSHVKTGEVPPAADDGTDGDPPTPLIDSDDGAAALRDDYFARLRPRSIADPLAPELAVIDGAASVDALLAAAVLVVAPAGLPVIGNGASRRRRVLRGASRD